MIEKLPEIAIRQIKATKLKHARKWRLFLKYCMDKYLQNVKSLLIKIRLNKFNLCIHLLTAGTKLLCLPSSEKKYYSEMDGCLV